MCEDVRGKEGTQMVRALVSKLRRSFWSQMYTRKAY